MRRDFAFELIITISLIGSMRTQYGWGGGIAATVAPFLSTSALHQVPPCNVGQDTANRPFTISEPDAARINTREKPEPSPSFLPSELLDQLVNGGTKQISASEGPGGQKTGSTKVPEVIAVQYVSNGGSDANDGLSWATAKHTIYGALVSLPGGGTNKAGSGTIYVGTGSSANPTAGAGIWLMNSADPNYSRPPAGWLKTSTNSIDIIGIANTNGGPNPHAPKALVNAGGTADNNHPALWISGNGYPIRIQNISFSASGRGIVLGECSNNLRNNTCGVTLLTLENVAAYAYQGATNGPCTDITGYSYWIWFRDFGCAGTASVAVGGYTANNAASILMDATVSNAVEATINDTNLDNGGIKFIPGVDGGGLYARNVIQEACCGAIPPTIWFTGWTVGVKAVLQDIMISDNPNSIPTVENDGAGGGPIVIGTGGVQGVATMLNSVFSTDESTSDNTVSPLRQGQTGFFGGYEVGNTDAGRRLAGLVPSRFENNAKVDTSTWVYPVSGTTFTQGLTDPFGGSKAASISYNAAGLQILSMGPTTSYKPTANDWIVVGVWAKGGWPRAGTLGPGCSGYGLPKFSSSFGNDGLQKGDGQWQYLWKAYKVASSGSATTLCAGGVYNNSITPTLYGPTLYIIPAGTISDNEVLEFASSMNSVDPGCRVGQICNVAGHPVVVSTYGTLANCSSATSPARCDSAPAGSFVLGVGSTAARVNTTAVTADSQILIIEDSSLGTKLGVSCNKTTGRTYMITDRSPGLSFTVSSSFPPTDHPACLSFQLLN
jgi:hypothetical protein